MKIRDIFKITEKKISNNLKKTKKVANKTINKIGDYDISEKKIKSAGKTALRRTAKTCAVTGAYVAGVGVTAIVASPGLVPALVGGLAAAVTYKLINKNKKIEKKDR